MVGTGEENVWTVHQTVLAVLSVIMQRSLIQNIFHTLSISSNSLIIGGGGCTLVDSRSDPAMVCQLCLLCITS